MKKVVSVWFHILLAFVFALATANPQPALAQDHVVAT